MRLVLHLIIFSTFLLYSQSMLVMWCLYFVEQQDIVLYYESAGENSRGLNYMHKLCDASKGEHDGALSLLKIAEQGPNFAAQIASDLSLSLKSAELCSPAQCSLYKHRTSTFVFRPPCV